MYLSSYLKKERPGKDQISILDYNLHCRDIGRYQSVQEFAYHVPKQELLHTTEVDIIGVSLNFSTSYRFFVEALAVLKAQFGTEVKIIVGGSHATNSTVQMLELESVNHVARGEAERGFTSYVEQMEALQRIDVVGIYGRNAARLDVPLENCEPIVDLDDIPLPAQLSS